MQVSVQIRRLSAATLICAVLVLGESMLIGAGHASSGRPPQQHTCSAADKQFLQTVVSNMTQLTYWSEAWLSGEETPATVVKQTVAESQQIGATSPTDISLLTARSLLRKMFLEYADAVHAKAIGKQPGRHIMTARTLANGVHDLLVDAQPQMASMGCDVTPLLSA
jgi:hypothetical protein